MVQEGDKICENDGISEDMCKNLGGVFRARAASTVAGILQDVRDCSAQPRENHGASVGRRGDGASVRG